jgi:hypothetical protein
MRDLYNNLTVIAAKAAAPTDNTALVSAVIDTKDFRSVAFLIATGTLADADATFTALMEESDAADLSGSNAVADADLLGTEAGASFQFDDDAEGCKIGYNGNKRYVRLTVTPSANSGAAPMGIIAVGEPRVRPAA